MATAQKRALPAKVAKMQARKKQKLSDGRKPRQEATASTRGAIGDKVHLDALRWTEVPLPDHMEDYEGFYGLEEIDDVEVVRDDDSGTLSFRIAGERALPLKSTQTDAAILNNGNFDSADDDEWSGISDGEDVNAFSNASQTSKSINDSEQTLLNGAFSLLENHGDDEDFDLPDWKELGLSHETLVALWKQQFIKPTAIQKAAIPPIMEDKDVIGKAQTGSGKTLAFGIPILERWLGEKQHTGKPPGHPTALIILPTRELAHQIEDHLKAMCDHTSYSDLSIATLTGGLSIQKQRRLLSKADIVIATPGRIWEVVSEGQGALEPLKKIQFLVLDEADRLLSEGHFKELEELLTALDREVIEEEPTKQNVTKRAQSKRQTLVFSATFSKGLQQKLSKQTRFRYDILSDKASMEYLLQKLNFRSEQPTYIDVNPIAQLASGLEEGLLECATGTEKDLYLYALLMYYPKTRALVFVNSISAVRRLVPFLQSLNLPALPLHSQMPQKARLRSIEKFSGQAQSKSKTSVASGGYVLIATDVAARGLDIPDVRLVVHYHLPRTADTYVHRSGRTARAENSGASVLICAPEEAAGTRRLVAQVHAQSSGTGSSKRKYAMQTVDMDKKVVSRLKPRATLAKKIADADLAKEKKRSETDFMAQAAEDLGVELDSDFEDGEDAAARGRGRQRKVREKAARETSKAEVRAWRAELRDLLSQRVNTGVSEKYLTSGGIDVDALLAQRDRGDFLGELPSLGFDGK